MALFLSHDVDQIHDRGLYRTLADLNHVRRVLSGREAGRASTALRRIGRSVFKPKGPAGQFERILRIEAAFGWRSTFFFLEGARWSRYGARYRLGDPRVVEIARMILAAGGEIGVHGGWHDLDDAAGYARSARRVAEAFGEAPVGIRNHFLRMTGEKTWKAQREAGFSYDATFGWSREIGHREGRTHPFFPFPEERGERPDFVVLPLTIMDGALFRCLGLGREEALKAAIRVADQTAAAGGLLSLLWHNNYFEEPEYEEWEEVYERLLAHLAGLKPWCATGAEIAGYWRSNASRGSEPQALQGEGFA